MPGIVVKGQLLDLFVFLIVRALIKSVKKKLVRPSKVRGFVVQPDFLFGLPTHLKNSFLYTLKKILNKADWRGIWRPPFVSSYDHHKYVGWKTIVPCIRKRRQGEKIYRGIVSAQTCCATRINRMISWARPRISFKWTVDMSNAKYSLRERKTFRIPRILANTIFSRFVQVFFIIYSLSLFDRNSPSPIFRYRLSIVSPHHHRRC